MNRTPGQGVSLEEREFMDEFGIQPGVPFESGFRKALDQHRRVVAERDDLRSRLERAELAARGA